MNKLYEKRFNKLHFLLNWFLRLREICPDWISREKKIYANFTLNIISGISLVWFSLTLHMGIKIEPNYITKKDEKNYIPFLTYS